jgi:hypothetical protein
MTGRTKLKITLYSTDNAIRSAIREAFKGYAYEVWEVTDSAKMARAGINEQQQTGTYRRLSLPDVVDYVVSKSALNSNTEGLAANLALKQGRNDVYAVVIPEALDWLRDKLAKKGELVLVGADQGK